MMTTGAACSKSDKTNAIVRALDPSDLFFLRFFQIINFISFAVLGKIEFLEHLFDERLADFHEIYKITPDLFAFRIRSRALESIP
jgi:hypothetical protein